MEPATIGGSFPFDVLGVIFDHYLDEETIKFPLETMLLVCRSWNEAALGHRNLWARLKIYLGHFPTSEIWKMRLPLRLERAGDSTLLDIDLRSILDSPNPPNLPHEDCHRCSRPRVCNSLHNMHCDCVDTARSTAKELLIMLAGPQGKLCHRWKSIRLCVGQFIDQGEELTYPTPNLEAVRLELPCITIHPRVSILPSIPKLKTFEVSSPFIFELPKLENVRHLVILDLTAEDSNLSNIKTATKVETLTLRIWRNLSLGSTIFPYFLPDFLPHLSSLSVGGNQLPHNLNGLQVPNIHKLSINLEHFELLKTVVSSSLPFQALQELELTWPGHHHAVSDELTIISNLLLSCINLTRIKGDRKSLSVIVKWHCEVCTVGRELIVGKTLSFWSNDMRRGVTVSGLEGKSELEGVVRTLRLIPPSMSWGYILTWKPELWF